ncbi:proteasome subunit beta [Pseudomonas sp. CCC3.2]|uniref:proteasome subunit beta n=1 Tax=unclassified Pseudomonas TaxID=196821 RepID=UPI002AB4BDE7|nr:MULTISPECIES: proteasome subunit beta [unclassified Pseudomonas]MDY7559949.1 proteasome subunit beta [Pseudomonas sp. AB6]MEA9994551.1 proteasome subunit beta [Pseudomonas sp. AA4]MEB0085696.1 proteasome subunit beta [Pseudomonas sp. RTI1]MEB0125979.1 proteasome subunit beta [Pseudomonas sp. CCC1.2]MEB0152783.1 proteasome subunit beta [Pseudomonas sp. CCC4.3]
MTTIAYKDGVVAYDSRSTAREKIVSDDAEKCIEEWGVKFILSGCASDFPALMDAYFGSEPRGNGIAGFAIDGGALWLIGISEDDGFWKERLRLDQSCAIGSGADHAITAMDMGASAAEAVEMAKKRDIYSGGLVRTLIVAAE